MPLRAFGPAPVFATVSEDGPARVLALHGWGRRGADFAGALEGLPYVAVDLPGFGASPPPGEAMGASGYATAISPVMDQLSSPAVLVGHSFGGRVAVHLAAAWPERWSGLILTGVPLLRRKAARRSPLPFRIARWAERRGLIAGAVMERVRQHYGSPDYRAARGVMRQVLVVVVNESYEDQLRALRCPVRLLWGADDTEVPVSVADEAARILGAAGVDVDLVVIPRTGHLLPTTDPGSLRRVIEELLAR